MKVAEKDMENLRVIQEEAVGIIKINENCQYNQVNAETVVIDENITARLFGTVNTIILNKGAKVFLHGMLLGKVENKGGEIYLYRASL